MNKPKITDHKTLFKSPYFEFAENTIDFGEDITRIQQNIYRTPGVSVFPITDDYEIYLVKEYRYLHNSFILEAVAGIIDEGESPEETAKRELKEEAGIIAETIKEIRAVDAAGSFIKATQHLLLAKDLMFAEPQHGETEQIEVVHMPLDEAVQKVLNGEIFVVSSMTGILLLDKLRQEGKL